MKTFGFLTRFCSNLRSGCFLSAKICIFFRFYFKKLSDKDQSANVTREEVIKQYFSEGEWQNLLEADKPPLNHTYPEIRIERSCFAKGGNPLEFVKVIPQDPSGYRCGLNPINKGKNHQIN